MIQFKKLDRFILWQFLPLFAMTFLICTFIVLMQFLWLHLQDLVGKGVGIGVLSELFFYAALSMVPMALPLAVLLASLMTFGNLGESFELTALKAGGISLFRVMKPLIVLMVFVAIGAFFFQNNVLPVAQTKMWTLLKSVRQKTPELDIVEGEFNYQLPNINIYVEEKNRESGMLYGVMIYDFRQGFDRSRVI
ncbi:MAG: LptF/LptG family permease, partial [Muribaculaceae bacterium]|nr:LptF/LptG family permease [Muribaculaceae bacterium]